MDWKRVGKALGVAILVLVVLVVLLAVLGVIGVPDAGIEDNAGARSATSASRF
jgi:uncharacterized membrane protein